MAKAKKQISKALRDKTVKNKTVTTRLAKDISNAFLVNRLMGAGLLEDAAAFDPFTFVVTIDRHPSITIKRINVNGVIAEKNDFKVTDDKIKCTVKAFVSTFTFLLIIFAEGEGFTSTTFNVTCDSTKVFEEDQKITISDSGRGGFSDTKVPLP